MSLSSGAAAAPSAPAGAAGASHEAALASDRAAVAAMPVAELRAELRARDVPLAGLIERHELVAALLASRAIGPGAPAAPSPAVARKIAAAASAFARNGDKSEERAVVSVGEQCGGPGCAVLSTLEAPLKSCAGCQAAWYCGHACQRADWKREGGHKATCKEAAARLFARN